MSATQKSIAQAIAFSLIVTGCSLFGRKVKETGSVALEPIESAKVVIEKTAGILKISGGAIELMEADFKRGKKDKAPEISYEVSGDQGELAIKDVSLRNPTKKRTNPAKDNLSVRLNRQVPMAMEVETGAEKSEIDMSGMSLTEVEVNNREGAVDLRLSGDNPQLSSVKTSSREGPSTLDMSGSYPVLDTIDIESIESDAEVNIRGNYSMPVSVHANAVSGEADIKMAGEHEMPVDVRVDAYNGKVKLELAGVYKKGADVRVDVRSGEVEVRVPADVGLMIESDPNVKTFVDEDLQLKEDKYVNELYGKTDSNLKLKVSGDKAAVYIEIRER